MTNRIFLLALLCLGMLIPAEATDHAVTGIYVGGHIRRERSHTIDTLRQSGFTYVILFNVTVETDGTLTTDGETICKDGKYVFYNTQPHYVEDIRLLKTPPTSISRIEICIGGWGNESYKRINQLVNKSGPGGGTGSTSILYRNFKALLDAVPGIDAVNNDDEHSYDVASAAQFHVMMYDLGLKTSLAPYTNMNFWKNLATEINKQRPGAVDRVMVQCYDGGAYNNPLDWNFPGIERHAGRTNYQSEDKDTPPLTSSIAQMEKWRDAKAATGAFVWVYNDESWNLCDWATNMNRIFVPRSTPEEEAVVEVFTEKKYKGYSVKLPVGKHTKADLSVYGLFTMTIASFTVKEGYSVRIYNSVDCTGMGQKYTANRSELTPAWTGKIQSLKVEKIESGTDITDAQALPLTLRMADGQVLVDGAKGQWMTLSNAAGAVLMRQQLLSDAETVSLQSLPRGIYVVQVGHRSMTVAR